MGVLPEKRGTIGTKTKPKYDDKKRFPILSSDETTRVCLAIVERYFRDHL